MIKLKMQLVNHKATMEKTEQNSIANKAIVEIKWNHKKYSSFQQKAEWNEKEAKNNRTNRNK